VSGRYSVKRIDFTIDGETFEFSPMALGYLPPVDETGAEPGSVLHDTLSIVEDANAEGRVVELGEEHAAAIAGFMRHFAGVYPELCANERRMLALVTSTN